MIVVLGWQNVNLDAENFTDIRTFSINTRFNFLGRMSGTVLICCWNDFFSFFFFFNLFIYFWLCWVFVSV